VEELLFCHLNVYGVDVNKYEAGRQQDELKALNKQI
jgi:hypothetical protein